MNQQAPLSAKDFRSEIKPIWCPGCGDYAVLSSLTKSFEKLGLTRENVSVISGIGCSSRLPQYLSVYGYHTIHGRALAVATGLKVARPDQTVITVGGDGDGFSIGGNHFIHSCRRNIDMTYIVMDNEVYGMTKGQASPTTDAKWSGSKLTPKGSGVLPFEPLRMGFASGASFVARAFAGNPSELTEIMMKAISHRGFSLVQVLSPCITWRPEHKDIKTMVHQGFAPAKDKTEARKNLMTDDGLTTGILYANPDAYVSYERNEIEPEISLKELEEQFAI